MVKEKCLLYNYEKWILHSKGEQQMSYSKTTFSVAKVFSSSMVLQREKNIRVFGNGENDTTVTVTLAENTVSTTVSNNKWTAILPPMEAGENYTMTITCQDETIIFDDIAIGEVWLAGGQSNMELEIQTAAEAKEILELDKDINVRYYYTEKYQILDDHFYELESQTKWHKFDEEHKKCWSAVAYLYAKKLSKELGVTVGIIGCNWGGTSASCWMSKESLSIDSELNVYLEDYNKATEGKTEEEQIREYDEYAIYQAGFDERSAKVFAEKPDADWDEVQEICGPSQWPGPMNCKNPYRPAGLYECMLQRVMPYTLRGFIYYQGESDDTKSETYYKLLSALISHWRKDWEDETLPFLFVQLPMHRYKADPDWKNWCMIREAQMRTFQTVKNTGLAVILDCGDYNEIHPKKKTPVAERLAAQALYHVYGKIEEKEAFGPIYQDCVYKNDGIELHFSYADEGFIVKEGQQMFEIAGEDKNYVPAKAKIEGNTIFVYSDDVKNPRYARYCWSNWCDVTIFNKNGIPLAPFRTSRNDGFVVDMNLK